MVRRIVPSLDDLPRVAGLDPEQELAAVHLQELRGGGEDLADRGRPAVADRAEFHRREAELKGRYLSV
jgi:hypothetical protein